MSFLTIEDVNTINLNHINEFYEIDTSRISLQSFSNVLYDFNIISHSINGSEHTFSFEIFNNLWSKLYHVANSDNEILSDSDVDVSFESNVLTVVTTEESIKLRLLLSSYYIHNTIEKTVTLPVNSIINLDKSETIINKNIEVYNYETGEIEIDSISTHVGNNVYEIGNGVGYVLINTIKTNLIYNLDNTILQVGIVNHVRLNVDAKYLPNGELVGEMQLDMQIKYGDILIPVEQIKNDNIVIDYGFDIDLTNKTDNKPINLTLIVNEIDFVSQDTANYELPCVYSSASSFEEFKSQLTMESEIIELTDNILFTNNIIIPNEVYIIGHNHTIYLNGYNINVGDNQVKFEYVSFEDGASCFIQENNSKLILNNCKFSNAVITDNYKGSVISSNDTNTITELSNCTFKNCHHSIYVGGELTVDNCKAKYDTWNNNVDTDYPAFATIFDGSAEIINSIFDIEYNTNELCSNEIDIKFAQSLISLSGDTVFNGVISSNLESNDILPFFDAPYNNLSHIFAKYYYPQIDNCVISSPVIDKEDKCVCHNILGNDWVYKNNVQVTRADWESENNNHRINWSDM